MISELKIKLLKEITKFTGIKGSLKDIKQGVEYPCFFCEYITSQLKTVATIDFMNIVDFDVIYFPKDVKEIENIAFELRKIKKIVFNEKEITVENINIDIIDDVLHYQVRVYARLENLKEIEPTLNTIKLIKHELEVISEKSVFYINANLEEIKKGFFTIEPSITETNNISIGGSKEYERELIVRYTSSDLNVDIYGYLENTLDKLIKAIQGKNGIYKANYNIDISYEKEKYEELNILNHEMILTITERKI